MRLIDADALFKDLEEQGIPFNNEINTAILIAPTVDAVPRWIPCEERLPKEYNEYLCCDKDGEYYVNYLEDAYWARKFTESESIVAWMPLPEPYDGERKDNEDS